MSVAADVTTSRSSKAYDLKETKMQCLVIAQSGEPGSDERRAVDGLIDAVIGPVLREFDVEAVVPHRSFQPDSIAEQVYEHVMEDELVIANLTEVDMDLVYELGVRHGTGKPIIAVAEQGTKLPRMLERQDTFYYVNDMAGAVQLAKALAPAVEDVLDALPSCEFQQEENLVHDEPEMVVPAEPQRQVQAEPAPDAPSAQERAERPTPQRRQPQRPVEQPVQARRREEGTPQEKPIKLPPGTSFRNDPFSARYGDAEPKKESQPRPKPTRTVEPPRRVNPPRATESHSYSSVYDLKEMQKPRAVQPKHRGKREVQEVKFGGGLSTGKVRSILTHMCREVPGSAGWYQAARWGEDIMQLAQTFTEDELEFLRSKGPNDVFDYLWQRYVDLSS